MRVAELKLADFRNYNGMVIEPGPGINILHGRNAQGKSNVLEAISLLATTRSLRASRESELIYREAETAHVSAEIDRARLGSVDLQVSVFQGDKKAVRVNGQKMPRVIDLLGEFNAVFFGTIDIPIVTGEPSTRRHYLNVEISQISPRYVYDLGRYKRVLEQRNRLLKDLRERPRPLAESGLEAWNEQLVLYGSPIVEKRSFYIDRLAPIADAIHQDLTNGNERLCIRYLPSVNLDQDTGEPADITAGDGEEPIADEAAGGDKPDPLARGDLLATQTTAQIASRFSAQLNRLAGDEARRGTTLLGPQRDDVAFLIGGAEARTFGSQGQQRTVALALKLAEFQLIEEFVGEPPVILLDDVMSDLDDLRRHRLLLWLQRKCQSFITCTNLRSFPPEILAEATTFSVLAGTITKDVQRKSTTRKRTAKSDQASAKQSGQATVSAGSASEA